MALRDSACKVAAGLVTCNVEPCGIRRVARLISTSSPVAPQVSGSQGCESKHHTSLGECCQVCGPGFGVSVPCGSANTQCEPCRANVTFSSVSSATEPCQPCSTCLEQAAKPCTPTSDMVCASPCAHGHYLQAGNGTSGQCLPCQVCPEGYGAVTPCGPAHDAVCSRCPDGFYSEEKSSVLPCLPCQPGCNESKVMIRPCSPLSNTLCMDKDLQILKRGEGDPRKELPRKPPLPEDNSKNIIPVYCSILAAVVVGLLAYVGFKCWNTCKQKQQLAKARAGELGGSPEGEKLHSDSGVFLDTHSLQEHHQLNKAPKAEPRLYINLPPHKQEEVEQLLESPSHSKDWRYLASQLGYEDEAIDTFGRGEAPAHTLLSDWSAKEGATLEALCAALAGIERPDVVDNLTSPAEASSVV
ncbi:PREDICTED: tumor necrosis factor receptor superfamily member 16-like [Gavialis gangeticus]|uniref:tumor necrosis factor receptor superfamily member 16-like n=1 Tax=Gavialis gangeticus TaxID=94835 RepID=UPI00092FD955|nr:PREDICTED: tumor necrosis factor receptor superfamily member 16-like [Gavialis gangeticus]